MTRPDRLARTTALLHACAAAGQAGLSGAPIIDHTLATFETSPDVDDIVVITAAGLSAEVERIVEERRYRKVSCVLTAGVDRSEDTGRALESTAGTGPRNVIVHDPLRPLVAHRIIADCVRALWTYEAVVTVVPPADTILAVDAGGIVAVPDRDGLRRIQTPQAFRSGTLKAAHQRAAATGHIETDDARVVLRHLPEVTVHTVAGSESNIKIEHAADITMAEALLRAAHAAES